MHTPSVKDAGCVRREGSLRPKHKRKPDLMALYSGQAMGFLLVYARYQHTPTHTHTQVHTKPGEVYHWRVCDPCLG